MQLLERETQLRILDDALRQARDGHGCTALIYGEAGIGKTSLVETCLQAHADSWRILRGACDSLFTPRPLGPLHDIALQTGGSLLEQLRAETDRFEMFTACLLEVGRQPAIVVVEDIHWADEATLDLLKFLGRRMPQTGSLLILTYRDDELGADHPLRRLLGELGTSASVRRLPLARLSMAALQELAHDRRVDVLDLDRFTNGNPFFVTEVLAAGGGISETVRDAVLARASRLSPAARRALEAAAIIGLRSEPWLLSIVAGEDIEAVEECIASGMLLVQAGLYSFRHELARQTILESATPKRRESLDRLALGALQASAETRHDLARLANHAKGTQDASLILEYAPLAARQASAVGAHRQAFALYQMAVQFAAHLPAERRAQLLDRYAEECEISGGCTEAEQTQQEALQLWRELAQYEQEGRALRRLSEIALRCNQRTLMERHAAEAVAVLEQGGASKQLAMAYSHRSRVHMVLDQADETIQWGKRAMEMAQELGDDETLMHALNNIGVMELWRGHPEEGRTKLERSLELALAGDYHRDADRALYNLAEGLLMHHEYQACLQYATQGLEYCSSHDLDGFKGGFLSAQGRAHLDQGNWMDAAQTIRHAPADADAESLDPQLHALELILRLRRGDVLDVEFVEALRSKAQVFLHDVAYPTAAAFAELAWLRGDLSLCRREAQPLYEAACELKIPRFMGEMGYWMWRAGAITEPPAGTAEPYAAQIAGDWRKAAAMWEKYGCPYERGMALMDGDEAAQLEALRIFEGLGAKPIAEKLKQQMRAQGMRGIPRGPRPSTRENAFGLTARELDVLSALVKGLNNNAIAKQLSLSTRTVEHHLASIFQKTGTQSRSEAVALALREQLIPSK